ncbi:hypothetical protein FRC11_008083 [Ceratobasidium sp. 423]|nr:hypothetical protein FRC11_008083 [Ceratobasidium sp. 423]
MSTWNTSEGTKASGVQEQKRVEYRGQSFANCYVINAQFEYSLVEGTHSTNALSQQTAMKFAPELSKDFIGQYYGPGLGLLNLNAANPFDYRKLVLAALSVIATDAVAIMRSQRQHLSNPALNIRATFNVDLDTGYFYAAGTAFTYVNWTQIDGVPEEALIYADTLYNLVHVIIDAVNLDLGSYRSPNMFRNTSHLRAIIKPNRPPSGIASADWATGTQAPYYYGNITSPFQTWAEMLLHGLPVKLGNPTGLPDISVMATTYLCPAYQIKPLGSLLSSVFVGSATMTLSVWSLWMFLTAFVAKKIEAPRVQCLCSYCVSRQVEEEEKRRLEEMKTEEQGSNIEASLAKAGMFARLVTFGGIVKRAKPTSNPRDEE